MIPETDRKKIPFTQKHWQNDLKTWLGVPMVNGEIMKNKGLLLPEGLEFKPLDHSKSLQKPVFIGIDTETFASNGNMICLSNSKNTNTLYGTPDKLPTIQEVITYLHNLISEKNTFFICWNLKFDASVILKCLDEKVLTEFYREAKNSDEDKERYTYDNGQPKENKLVITYLHKKSLSMTYKTQTVVIYDAMQFFLGAGKNGSSSLDAVAEEYLGQQKQYNGKYQDKQFPDKISQKEMEMIVEYCQLDCTLTAKLMDRWVEDFFKNFSFYPSAFYSAGYLASQLIKSKLDSFSSFRKIPFAVQDLAYNAYFGGRFEIMEKGRLQNIYHYDINSAYPYAMTLLPDFENGKWIKITNIDQWKKHKKKIGFYKVHVNIKEKNVAPLLYRNGYGQVSCPRGEFITTTTSFELESALNYDMEIKRIIGFCFIPAKQGKTKFNKIIEDMYQKRLQQKNKGQKFVYKVLVNSVYGKFAQAKPKPKNLFNPVYCAAITGKCRAMLLDAAKDNKDDIVMFATDGVFSKAPLKYCEKTTGKKVLGEWEKEFHPDMLLVMAGVYSVNYEVDGALETRSRGFSLRVHNKESKTVSRFDLDEYELKLDNKNGKYYYEIFNMRPVAISQAVIQHKYSKEDIAKFEYVRKELDLNGDSKRVWEKTLTNVHQHSYSRTMQVV